MFLSACPCAAADRSKFLLEAPHRVLLLSGSPGTDLAPYLQHLTAAHPQSKVIHLGQASLPGLAGQACDPSELKSSQRLAHAASLAVTCAQAGLLPVVALPTDQWGHAAQELLATWRRRSLPALHAHVFQPLSSVSAQASDPMDLINYGIMYKGTTAKTAHSVAFLGEPELDKVLAKARSAGPDAIAQAPMLGNFLRKTLLNGPAGKGAHLQPRQEYDLVVPAHALGAKASVSRILKHLPAATIPHAQFRAHVPQGGLHDAVHMHAPLCNGCLSLAEARLNGSNMDQPAQPVHLMTYLSKNFAETGHGEYWKRTSSKYGWTDVTIIGTETGWPGLGKKIERFRDFLQGNDWPETDLVLVTDADDVLLNLSPSEVVAKYNAIREGKELVISTEPEHCWPNRIVLPGTRNERYPSLNVGLFLGTKRALLKIYNWELKEGFNEDQIRFQTYLEYFGTKDIFVDYKQQLFSCVRDDYAGDVAVTENGQLKNTYTNTTPAAVHFPGPLGKKLLKRIEGELETKGV